MEDLTSILQLIPYPQETWNPMLNGWTERQNIVLDYAKASQNNGSTTKRSFGVSSLIPHGPGSPRPPNLIPWHIPSITKFQDKVYLNTRGSISVGRLSYSEERESRPKESTYKEKAFPLP